MRISTKIDWSYFSRFMTKKTKRVILIIAMIIIYTIYDRIEWIHHNQMRTDDNFWATWSWVIAIPAGLWWLWAEVKRKHSQQFVAGLLFLFLGPVLAMGTELRNLSTFSETERWEMLVCMIIGVAAFAGYIKAKVF